MANTEDTNVLQNLKDELEAERDWRINEFARIKILFRKIEASESEDYANTYLKMTVPMLYAHWEGFCIASFKLICEYINTKNLNATEVTDNILTYANDATYSKLKGKQSFAQKVEFSRLFSEILFGKINIKTRINTKSNLNADALEGIFGIFNLNYEPLQEYSRKLNEFVNVRNAIAHGENSILIDKGKMNDYITLVVELIDAVVLELIIFVEEKRYFRT